jgi:NTE family protein
VEISLEKDRALNNERFALALALDSYLRTRPVPKDYVHLLDGGVSDNLGLRGPLRALQQNSPETPWSLLDMLNTGRVRTVVVIAVNAKPAPPSRLDAAAGAPGLVDVAVAAGTIPMENYTFETSDLFRSEIAQIREDEALAAEESGGAATPIRFYYAEVRFDALEDEDERACYNALPTRLELGEAEVEALAAIGPQLLCAQDEYRRLRAELGVTGGCSAAPPPKPVLERRGDSFCCRFELAR